MGSGAVGPSLRSSWELSRTPLGLQAGRSAVAVNLGAQAGPASLQYHRRTAKETFHGQIRGNHYGFMFRNTASGPIPLSERSNIGAFGDTTIPSRVVSGAERWHVCLSEEEPDCRPTVEGRERVLCFS